LAFPERHDGGQSSGLTRFAVQNPVANFMDTSMKSTWQLIKCWQLTAAQRIR